MTKDEVVIPGLYAAGEVVGQMWGRTIAPGVAMNEIGRASCRERV